MTDGPWTKYATPTDGAAPTVDQPVGPWMKYAQSKPQSPPDAIDYNRPMDDVRADIAKLPAEHHDAAIRNFGEAQAAQDRKSGLGSLPMPRVPVVSAIGDQINAGIEGGVHALTGAGKTYEESLAYQRAMQRQAEAQLPTIAAVGNLAGGFMLPVPGPAATAIGRIGQAAGYAGSVSAADAALNTDGSPVAKANAALTHGLVGLAAGGVVGGAAEKLGQWWSNRALANETAKYFDKATGELTAEGQAAAQQMGADPAQMVATAKQNFAKTYAANPAEAQNMIGAGKLDFDIPQTLGQRTKDAEQLMAEKAMRSGIYGDQAKSVITNLDHDQSSKVADAARSIIPNRLTPSGVSRKFDADVPFDAMGDGQIIQKGLQTAKSSADAAEDAAWAAVPAMTPSRQALDMLPEHLSNELASKNVIVDENTAVAGSMVKRLGQFMRGESPTQVDPILNGKPIADVDRMRRQLFGMMKSAEGEDKRAASSVYGAYNDWIGTVAKQKLLSGDAEGYTKLIAARDVTRNLQGLFSPTELGRQTPGARILKSIMTQDTPENIINSLFSGAKAGIKNGSVEALQNIKTALQQHTPPEIAEETISALRIAHWAKLVQGKDGQLLSPQVQLNNIRSAMQSQGSLLRELYRPQDEAIIRRYANQLEQITWKDPNPSGTATGLASLAKQMFGKVIDVLGPVGKFAYHYSGVPETYGKMIAQKAARQATPTVASYPPLDVVARAGPAASGLAGPLADQIDPRRKRGGMALTRPN